MRRPHRASRPSQVFQIGKPSIKTSRRRDQIRSTVVDVVGDDGSKISFKNHEKIWMCRLHIQNMKCEVSNRTNVILQRKSAFSLKSHRPSNFPALPFPRAATGTASGRHLYEHTTSAICLQQCPVGAASTLLTSGRAVHPLRHRVQQGDENPATRPCAIGEHAGAARPWHPHPRSGWGLALLLMQPVIMAPGLPTPFPSIAACHSSYEMHGAMARCFSPALC